MTGWTGNIEAITLANSTFRTVLFTGSNLQLTVMSLQPERRSASKCMIIATSSSE